MYITLNRISMESYIYIGLNASNRDYSVWMSYVTGYDSFTACDLEQRLRRHVEYVRCVLAAIKGMC